MTLNKTEGETLPIIGRGKVVPVAKWAEKFDMVTIATTAAGIEFAKLGAPRPIKLSEANMLVMEYHLLSKVVWVFWMQIKGKDYYYHYTFDLGEKVIGELAVVGDWPIVHAMPRDARLN
jgi:hypothetical protein